MAMIEHQMGSQPWQQNSPRDVGFQRQKRVPSGNCYIAMDISLA